MQKLVENNTDLFKTNSKLLPILPKNQEEYCALLQKLSKSIGIGVKPLTQAEVAEFDKTISSLVSSIQNVDLNNARLNLKMPREDFVSIAQDIMKNLKPLEKNKVMDYFGFEIKDGKLIGYPLNVNNGAKLSEIENKATKKAIKTLRPVVEVFSNSSNIVKIDSCKNAQALEDDLNRLFNAFPELRSIIGRAQHHTHAFSLDIHTLKVLQNVCANLKFAELSESDKKVLEISALLHDITKAEGLRDATHPFESAFDAYYIIQKLNLPESEQLKIYELIKTHNWLERLNTAKDKDLLQNIAQDVAFDSRHTNTFELAKILCESDLKSVKKDDSFFNRYKKNLNDMSNLVDSYIERLHKTQIVFPQTRIPKASQIINGEIKSSGGIRNTVIYMKKLDDDLSKYGFDKNTTKENFLGLVHALEYEEQLRKFDTFSVIDNEALLSTSYIKSDDYRAFRKQGLILDVAYDDIQAGYYRDFGTGYSKSIELLKQDYLFHGTRKNILEDDSYRDDRTQYRDYISSLIKDKLNLNDGDYIEYMKKIKDCKTITDIEKVDKTFAQGLLDVFKNMQSGRRKGGRAYSEMLVTRPKTQGVFAYDKNYEAIPKFLRKYAQENDIPIVIF